MTTLAKRSKMTQNTILIVEDDWFTVLDTQKQLERMGYTVADITATGEAAIEKAEELSPDLILMDIMLKGDMDGIQAAQTIHEKFGIPIVYLTAYGDKEIVDRAKISVPFGYITKPYEASSLQTAIDIALYKHKMEMRLRQAQKMESLGTLAGGIAHEFNNILSIILGNNELAMMDIPAHHPVSQYLNEIHTASIRARDMVRQLLTFSRKDMRRREPLNFAAAIEKSLNLIRASIPAHIEIAQRIETDLDWVEANATQIDQILINLCTNAADAMTTENGRIVIETVNETLDAEQANALGLSGVGTYVKLTVSDNGCGMPQDIMDRIFEPYYTTKETGKGTGVGLSVVHGIVEQHHGAISVSSKPGAGAVFTLWFPTYKGPMIESPKPVQDLPGGTERILMVDDEAPLLNLGKERLERLGYQVTTTTNATEALEMFLTDQGGFDLVITDMAMPGMTGAQLAAQLIAGRPDVPIILCTGYSELISEEKAREIGISAFAMKPLDGSELATQVRQVLDQRSEG